MSLDPMPDNETLLAMLEARQRRAGQILTAPITPLEVLGHTRNKILEAMPFKAAPAGGYRYEPTTKLPEYGTLTLRIPWSALVSDNAKSRAARRGDSATIVLTPAYRDAKRRIGALAAEAMAGRAPLAGPLALVARVWVPDARRRDVVNFSKALHDALTGVVFCDDSQLYDTRWIRAGVDVDAPRAEITLTPLP